MQWRNNLTAHSSSAPPTFATRVLSGWCSAGGLASARTGLRASSTPPGHGPSRGRTGRARRRAFGRGLASPDPAQTKRPDSPRHLVQQRSDCATSSLCWSHLRQSAAIDDSLAAHGIDESGQLGKFHSDRGKRSSRYRSQSRRSSSASRRRRRPCDGQADSEGTPVRRFCCVGGEDDRHRSGLGTCNPTRAHQARASQCPTKSRGSPTDRDTYRSSVAPPSESSTGCGSRQSGATSSG
mgnify:CR=1 FL=1